MMCVIAAPGSSDGPLTPPPQPASASNASPRSARFTARMVRRAVRILAPVSLREKAELLRSLHAGPHILVLPNAWDVASARIFEDAGARAVATTSAGVAN